MRSAVILQTDNNVVRKISAKDYGIINIGRTNRVVKVNEVLPFRVKFMNVRLKNLGTQNPTTIGYCNGCFNNYIL